MIYRKLRICYYVGFTLIEVLISILILSIAVIGAIKMQINSIQMTQQSNYFSTAVELATEIAEKMRGNGVQLQSAASPFLKVNFHAGTDKIESSTTCFSANCSPDQLAESDIAEWLQHISSSLPDAHAVICQDDSPWDGGDNSLTWNCAASGNKSSVIIKLGWAEKKQASQTGFLIAPPRLAIAVISTIN